VSNSKFVVPAAVVLLCAMGAGAAQARDVDVQWSVTIGTPGTTRTVPVYSAPVPEYGYPVPVYRQPPPVYRYVVPVYGHNRYYRVPTAWDRDGDGIPNRYDRVYNPVWDRDGDGIPDRRDARYNPPWDRDGDGIPNRHDRDGGYRPDRGGHVGGR
jgi:hypothetical protein